MCKWALLDMEQRGIDHGVENYFGYDGPNRGANITVGLQALLRDFQSVKMGGKTIEDAVPEIRNGIQVVRSKFAVSRLLAQGWVNDKFASFRQLEDEFNTKGLNHDGKLVKANYFATANGAVNGSDQIGFCIEDIESCSSTWSFCTGIKRVHLCYERKWQEHSVFAYENNKSFWNPI